MPLLPFGEYKPDASDINNAHTQTVLNVLPQSDGYGPMKSCNPFTGALAAVCRGAFMARREDGSISIFAGTETRLYKLDNTTLTWTDVSKGGNAYSSLDSTANWRFAQFGSKIIAVQANVVPQVFDVEVDSAFADLGGSPPQAAYITIINRFVVLSGLNSYPRRVQWSGLNAITTWTSGTTYSDYQDLPDGGNLCGVIGGENGIIIQDNSLRAMTFSPGSDIIFRIDRIAKDVGCAAPESIVEANGLIYFLSPKGFIEVSPDGAITPIGFEKVDRTFFRTYDATNPQLIQGAVDPETNMVLWSYRESTYSTTGQFNKILAYNRVMRRWAPIEIEGEYLVPLGKPGLTLESLGTIGSTTISGAADNGSGLVRLTVTSTTGWTTGDIKQVASVTGTTEANGEWTITVVDGTHIDLQGSTFANAYVSGGYVEGSLDDIEVSFDDFSAATLNSVGMFTSAHKLGYFTGDTLEATLTTAEQTGMAKRLFIRGLYPLTDAETAYGSIAGRESLKVDASYSSETAINARGMCPARVSTRHARAKLRIPAAETWTFATGIEPDYSERGSR